jgi:hypothetical protein
MADNQVYVEPTKAEREAEDRKWRREHFLDYAGDSDIASLFELDRSEKRLLESLTNNRKNREDTLVRLSKLSKEDFTDGGLKWKAISETILRLGL